MSATGYIQARAYASNAQIPIKDVAVTVTSGDGTVIAMRLTDRSGLTSVIPLPVPDLAESQQPNPGESPFAVVNLYAWKRGYESIESENLQVFPGITTTLNLEMIPLSELPNAFDQIEIFNTPPQNLKR